MEKGIADVASEAALPVDEKPRKSSSHATVPQKTSVIWTVDARGARGDQGLSLSTSSILECISVEKRQALGKRGLTDELSWRAVSAVALAAGATVVVDSRHGERRLSVSLPAAGGNCVVILAQHRRSCALAVVTAFHDARRDGHCRQEFLDVAASISLFVTPESRLECFK
jgi:hypothetical protein